MAMSCSIVIVTGATARIAPEGPRCSTLRGSGHGRVGATKCRSPSSFLRTAEMGTGVGKSRLRSAVHLVTPSLEWCRISGLRQQRNRKVLRPRRRSP
jgi:hypothetical protein